MMTDLSTLLYASVFVSIPIMAMLLIAAALNRKVPGAVVLAVGLVVFIASFILQGMDRGPWLTLFANTLTGAGLYLIWLAYKRFNERQCPGMRWHISVLVAYLAIQAFFPGTTYWHQLYEGLLLSYGLLIVLILSELLHPANSNKLGNRIVAIVYVLLGLSVVYAMSLLPYSGYSPLYSFYSQYVDVLAFLLLPLLGFSYFISLTDYMGKHLSRLADTDYLTGLPGQRAFYEQAERILQRASFNQTPVSLLIINIDDFKQLNREYGSSAGDQVLMHYTRNMLEFFRIGDVLCRVGWDEFMVLLPGTDELQANRIGERLRDLFDVSLVDIGTREVSATVSIGGSSAPGQPQILDELCRHAHEALVRAKQLGKHCVVIEPCGDIPQALNEESSPSP